MDRDPTGRRCTAAALLAGALLRLFFLLHHPRFSGDSLVYGDLAHNLLAHHVFGFTEDTLRPTLIRLPGYPLFLAVCFLLFGNANYVAVICVQAVLDLLTCVLLGRLAGQLWGVRAGRIALGLATLCPFTANYAAAPLTETLSLLCAVLAFYALARWSALRSLCWAAVLGLSLAYAVLLRPDQGLLAAAILPAMLWIALTRGRPASLPRRFAAPTFACALVVLPLLLWGVRNWRVFHVVQPLAPRYANDPGESVPFGFQRWYRTWALDFKSTVDVYWQYDGSPVLMKDLPARAFDTPAQRAETAALLARYNDETASTPAFDAAFARLAALRVAAHPLRYFILLPVGRELDMWLRPRTELLKAPLDWWNLRAHPVASVAELTYALLDAAYLVLALAGIFLWRSRPSPLPVAFPCALAAFVGLRCLLLLTIDNSEPRYTLECFPVVILLGACALAGSASSREVEPI